jgi:hypothetical protein
MATPSEVMVPSLYTLVAKGAAPWLLSSTSMARPISLLSPAG